MNAPLTPAATLRLQALRSFTAQRTAAGLDASMVDYSQCPTITELETAGLIVCSPYKPDSKIERVRNARRYALVG